ncbi:MAG: hypothetical protein WCH46_09135 [bacterium]
MRLFFLHLIILLSFTITSCMQAPDSIVTKARSTITWPGSGTSCTDLVGPLHNRILHYIGLQFDSTYLDSSLTSYFSRIEYYASRFASDSLLLTGSQLDNYNNVFSKADRVLVDTVEYGGSYLIYPYSKYIFDSLLSRNLINNYEYSLLDRFAYSYNDVLFGNISNGAFYDTVQSLLANWSGHTWPSSYGVISGATFKLFNSSYGFWNGSRAHQKQHPILQLDPLTQIAGADAIGFGLGVLYLVFTGVNDPSELVKGGIVGGAGFSGGAIGALIGESTGMGIIYGGIGGMAGEKVGEALNGGGNGTTPWGWGVTHW